MVRKIESCGHRLAALFTVALAVLSNVGFAVKAELPLDQAVNGDFEAEFSEGGRKAFGWNRFGKCYRVEKNAGENGSAGLVWRNDDPKRYEVAAAPIRLEPGATYEISCRYKTVRLETPVKATGWVGLCVECKDAKGNFTKGIYQGGYKATNGKWRGIYQIGMIPEDAVVMTVSPTVGPGFVGEVHFDSIVVRRAAHKPVFGLYVSAYRDQVTDGKFEVVAGLDLKSAKINKDDYEPVLAVPLASGDKKRLSACEYGMESARFMVDAESLPLGKSSISFVLRNRKTGEVGEGCRVERVVERLKEMPCRKVAFDVRNRLIVDGKPFFPLGLYWSVANPKEEDVAEYAKSPFNCLLNYRQLTSAVMDAYDRHGLKVIYSIEGIYAQGCANVTADGVTVQGGHDGFDFFGCDKVLVENCRIFSGDDCVAGYNNRGVTVRNCELNSSCSFFRVGGRDVLVENCRGSAPARHPHRWSLSDADKRMERTPEGTGRRNTLSVLTFFTGKSVKEPTDGIVFRKCRFDGVDKLMHYNLSGNERWQNGRGLAKVKFEDVSAKGLARPLIVYGERECPLALEMQRCEISFRAKVETLFRGAHVRELLLDDVSVSGAEALMLNYGDISPE